MKILCVCGEGNVRSATLARLLKHKGHETLAAGVKRHSQSTLKMLMNWADKVYVVDKELLREMSLDTKEDIRKTEVFDLGPDIWGEAMHPDLVRKIEKML